VTRDEFVKLVDDVNRPWKAWNAEILAAFYAQRDEVAGWRARCDAQAAEVERLTSLITIHKAGEGSAIVALRRAEAEVEALRAERDEWKRQRDEACDRRVEWLDQVEKSESLMAEAVGALKGVEWVVDISPPGYWCPECENERANGHRPECVLGAVLAKVRP
jgi:hypothetical protein